jgi:plastocyanin
VKHVAVAGALLCAAVPAAALAAPKPVKPKPVVKQVSVVDDVYGAKTVKLVAGDSINWVWDKNNYDSHDVTLQKGPKGVKKFQSPSGSIGIKYKKKFDTVGTYQIYCTIHPETMFMTVVVKKPPKTT